VTVGLVTSLSASFTRWRASNKDKRADSSSVVSDQSVMSAVSDTVPSALLSDRDCETTLHPDAAATPIMIRKRRAANEVQPFSTTKK